MNILSITNIFYTLVSIVTFLVIANLLTQRKKPSSMVAWIVVILFVPYVGIILYIIFHGRKMSKVIKKLRKFELLDQKNLKKSFDSDIEKLIYKNSFTYATYNRDFYLCLDGIDAHSRLIELLKSAKESIYICTYIFGKDEVSKEIVEILSQKAKQGVEVKLLIDAIGSFSLELNPSFLRSIEKSGGEYKFFMSVIKEPFSSKLNLRNHRKMVVVDHIKLLSGGINIAKEYFQKEGWIDLSFIIEGASAYEYEEIFLHNWYMNEELPNKKSDIKKVQKGDHIVQVVPSGPDIINDTLYEATLQAIYKAKKRIFITTPYFAPESSILDALLVAKHRGVDVRIITPKSSDHLFVDIAKDAFLRELHEEGVQILYYSLKMLHAKAVVVDDELAILGSANFDSRSFFYNFEIVSFFYNKSDIIIVTEWIENLFEGCEYGMKEVSIARRAFENLFKILAPAL